MHHFLEKWREGAQRSHEDPMSPMGPLGLETQWMLVVHQDTHWGGSPEGEIRASAPFQKSLRNHSDKV